VKRHPFVLGFLIVGLLIAVFYGLAVLTASLFWDREPTRFMVTGDSVGVVAVEGVIFDSKEIVEDLVSFRKDEKIKAIVLRVDSPGGAVAPSQEIFREVKRTRETKPVVVSMGSIAASGGYYVACPADHIVANEGTLTGSIGVIFSFLNVEGLYEWIGIKSRVIKSGEFKDIGSATRDMTPAEKALLQEVVDDVYDQFVMAVSESRHIEPEKVRAFADGRIFSGRKAKDLGLVDEMGGFQEAVQSAANLAGIEGEPELVYPKRKRPNPFDLFFGELFGAARAAAQRQPDREIGLYYR
jgi:protease-4